MAAAVLLSSCVKDTLYDTPHPDYGKIAVTADWSARGEGIDIPTTWTVTMGDYTGTETSATHAPNHLFAPGSYTLAVWNPAEGIMVNGTTATIAAATGNRAGTDAFVNNAPGWFFTYTKQVSIEKDKDYPLTAAMKQQVRELTLIIKPTGGCRRTHHGDCCPSDGCSRNTRLRYRYLRSRFERRAALHQDYRR